MEVMEVNGGKKKSSWTFWIPSGGPEVQIPTGKQRYNIYIIDTIYDKYLIREGNYSFI